VKQNLARYCLRLLGIALLLAIPTLAPAATVGHWNFDQGISGDGFDFPGGIPVPDISGNNATMFGFNDAFSPHYSAAGVSPNGVGLSSRHVANPFQDGFTLDATLNGWEPQQWTIETAFNLDLVDGFRTLIGRDGTSFPGPDAPSDFYLQVNAAAGGVVRLDFATVAGPRVAVNSTLVPTAGQWYRVAATSDNLSAKLWIDRLDGNGYQLEGTTAIPGAAAADRALASPNANWTFGRGWFNTFLVDGITGNLDEVRFSDVALVPGQFIPEPAAWQLIGMMLLGLAGYRGAKRSGS
jgi:hypothetical protein